MFNISEHNTVTAVLIIQAEGKQYKKGKDIHKTCFKTNADLLEQFAAQMQCRLIEKEVTKFEELNAMMREVAETLLKFQEYTGISIQEYTGEGQVTNIVSNNSHG